MLKPGKGDCQIRHVKAGVYEIRTPSKRDGFVAALHETYKHQASWRRDAAGYGGKWIVITHDVENLIAICVTHWQGVWVRHRAKGGWDRVQGQLVLADPTLM